MKPNYNSPVKKPKFSPKRKSPVKYESEHTVTEEEDDESDCHAKTENVHMVSEDESEEGYYGGYQNDFHTQPKLTPSH